jgi:hypothetical protein
MGSSDPRRCSTSLGVRIRVGAPSECVVVAEEITSGDRALVLRDNRYAA